MTGPIVTNPERAALDLDRVGVLLAGREVLHGVTLSVRPGELLGVVGPNGAGKTTLLRTILGLIPCCTGTVHVDRHRHHLHDIGYVPQRHEFAWDFPVSVEDAVVSGRVRRIGWLRRPAAADYHAAYDAIERVQLTALRRRPIGELSGGQRQRVLVARALALQPAVLLLDEPFTGLDIPSQELLGDLFHELARDGTTLVMTTHDLPGAMHTCSRLCLLNRTVIATGRPDELTDPQPWMRAFGFSPTSPLLTLLAHTGNGHPS